MELMVSNGGLLFHNERHAIRRLLRCGAADARCGERDY
jgi:hypothetical protein